MALASALAGYQVRNIYSSQGRINLFYFRPTLKCTQFGKYKKEYEEKIAIAEANIDEAVRQCSAVVEIHTKLSAEKNELVLALQSGGSAVQV